MHLQLWGWKANEPLSLSVRWCLGQRKAPGVGFSLGNLVRCGPVRRRKLRFTRRVGLSSQPCLRPCHAHTSVVRLSSPYVRRRAVPCISGRATHFGSCPPFGSARTQKSARRADPNTRASAFRPRATHFRFIFESDLRRRAHETDAHALAFFFFGPAGRCTLASSIQQQPRPPPWSLPMLPIFGDCASCRRPQHPSSNAAISDVATVVLPLGTDCFPSRHPRSPDTAATASPSPARSWLARSSDAGRAASWSVRAATPFAGCLLRRRP